MSRFVIVLVSVSAAVSACASGASQRGASGGSAGPASGGNLNTCVGSVQAAVSGARAVEDGALLARAVAPAEQGKLCSARVFEATEAITVYRVSQADRANREPGRWWTFRRPEGTREQYRTSYVICAEWSALDTLARCQLRVGARFVVGTGQSVRCQDGSLIAQSAEEQVYIDNDTREGRVLVENCERLGAWPGPSGAFSQSGQ